MIKYFTTILCGLMIFNISNSQIYRPITQGFGTYLQTHLSTDSMLEALSDMGFNRMMLEPHQMHPKANSEGISVELANWWAINADSQQVANVFQTASAVNDLIAINIADEPYLNGHWNPIDGQHSYPASFYKDFLPPFKAQYPDIPLAFTLYGPWGNLDNTHTLFPDSTFRQILMPYYELVDKVRILPYTHLYNTSYAQGVKMIEMSREMIDSTGKDMEQTVVLQTWSPTDNGPNPNFPSIENLRVQIFASMLMGVDGISFFTFNPEVFDKIPGFTQDFKDLIQEAIQFGDTLTDFRATTWLNQTNTVLQAHLVATHLPRRDYCIAINLMNNFQLQFGLTPYEIRIYEAGDCPWELPADSTLDFLQVGIDDNPLQNDEMEFSYWQKPGSNQIMMKSPFFINNPISDIQLFSLEGKVLKQFNENSLIQENGVCKLSIPNVERGVYFFRIQSKKGYLGKRIFINEF